MIALAPLGLFALDVVVVSVVLRAVDEMRDVVRTDTVRANMVRANMVRVTMVRVTMNGLAS